MSRIKLKKVINEKLKSSYWLIDNTLIIKYLDNMGVTNDLKYDLLIHCYEELLYCHNEFKTDLDLLKWYKSILRNNWKSVTSPFYKIYRSHFNTYLEYNEDFDVIDNVEEDIDLENRVNNILKKYKNPYDIVLFNHYKTGKTYNELVDIFNIDYQTIRNRIISVRKYIKENL
jgi:hypothetical protein